MDGKGALRGNVERNIGFVLKPKSYFSACALKLWGNPQPAFFLIRLQFKKRLQSAKLNYKQNCQIIMEHVVIYLLPDAALFVGNGGRHCWGRGAAAGHLGTPLPRESCSESSLLEQIFYSNLTRKLFFH
jgi:hypothetical protein